MKARSVAFIVASALTVLTLTAVSSPSQAAPPSLDVEVLEDGLSIPWDLTFLPDGAMLFTQRDLKTVTLRKTNGDTNVVLTSLAANAQGMWNNGETGLMGIEADTTDSTGLTFFTCHGYKSGTTQDVRVVRWRLNAERTSATLDRTLFGGLPSTTGRHGGCALLKGGSYALYVGTGDAATGKNPQSRTSGGGKVLRVDTRTGAGWSTNPYISSSVAMKRRLFTYGHRNVQGLARHSSARVWSVEHGSYRDDEVNALVSGGNYGWNPVPRRAGDPSYNEGSNSPMTDYAIKGTQRGAAWRSGDPTVATSGATFLYGSMWGEYEGRLAVTALKDQSLRIIPVTSKYDLGSSTRPPALNGTFGRLRAAVQGPDGALYLTTSNGGGTDKILRVTPN
ncbi:PQQ-dependent sugar dehydrogenase [Aeromicrobium sp.]|uniref:PQQ-dependent sugar dehydrogenase n=1 Tax=Aeromicrobium sp. TaxID=1871063 RepID=UPI002FC73BD5